MRFTNLLLVVVLLITVIGCSSGVDIPVVPGTPGETGRVSNAGEFARIPLGFYTFTANPDAGTLDAILQRNVDIHVNGIVLLESGPQQLLQLAGPPQFSNGGKTLDVDVKITHPNEDVLFTVFDVHGIILTKGSIGDWEGSDVIIAGPEKTRLMNADGHTRWWNPRDFKNQGLYGYTPGAMGSLIPKFQAATINGYKTFADGLVADSDMSDLDPAMRGMFSADSDCTRHYTISLASGLVFNYAVDASWAPPTATPPTPPDDFPPSANMPEPYWIEIEEWNNTLWYNSSEGHGGNVFYYITVHDRQSVDGIGWVRVEIPQIGINQQLTNLVDTGPNHKKFELCVILPDLESSDDLEMLVTVESLEGTYQESTTGVDKPLRAYNLHFTVVGNENPGANQPPVCEMSATTETEIDVNIPVSFEALNCYDPDGLIINYSWDFDGDEDFNDTWDSGTEIEPTYIFQNIGIYDVRLRIRDNDGEYVVSDPVTITVHGEPPVAAAEIVDDGPYLMYYSYLLSGAASNDPDGEIELYEWDIDYDGSFDPTLTGEEVEAVWELEGDYEIMLRVTDADDQADMLDEAIPITIDWSDNHPPIIDELTISRTTVYRGSTTEVVELNITAHDPDVDDTIEGYQWVCDSGYFDDDSIPNPTWYPPNFVTKMKLKCIVTDNHGAPRNGYSPMIRVTSHTIKEPSPAPDYESERLVGTGTFWFHDYTPGKVVLMNFWSTG